MRKRCQPFVFLLSLLSYSLFLSQKTWAEEFRPFYRGARAQAMGGAFTSVADDEQALFYNPAGLAGVKDFGLHLATINAEAASYLIDNLTTFQSQLSGANLSTLNAFIGKNISGRGQFNSTLVLPRMAFSVIYDTQIALRLKDLTFPSGLVGAQTTYGFQGGFGTPVLRLKKKKGELRLGMAGKLLWRSGRYQNMSLTQIVTLNPSTITSNFNSYTMGVLADFGAQFIYRPKKNLSLQVGAAFKDFNVLGFGPNTGPQNPNFAMGVSGTLDNGEMKVTLAYDYDHFFDVGSFGKKSHLGLEVKFPLVSFYGGLYQGSLTYGAGFDLALVRVMYVAYTEEQSNTLGKDPEGRHLLNVSIKLGM